MQGFIGIAFAKSVMAKELLVQHLPTGLDDWIDQLYLAAGKVRSGQIDTRTWQLEMDKLYKLVDIRALIAHIDMDKLKRCIDYDKRGEKFTFTPLRPDPVNPVNAGVPLDVNTLFASVKKGCHVPPHGHKNQCSAFLILSGQMHTRQYDRVSWDTARKTLVIRKAVDEMQYRGQWSSVSDYRNNCHWLTAESDDCYFFSTRLSSIQPNIRTIRRLSFHYEAGTDIGSGLREVPLISNQRAEEIYNQV